MGLTELLLVIAVGGGIIAVLYPTLKGAASEAGGTGGEPGAAGGGWEDGPRADAERAELEERRAAALRSLEEVETDHDAGNLSDEDYERQRRRYEREAALLLRELEGAGGRPERSPASGADATMGAPTPRRSRLPVAVAWTAATVGFVALAALLLTNAIRPRSEGDVMTGTVPGMGGGGPGSGAGMGAGQGSLVPVDEERIAELEERVARDSSDVDALVELGHLYLASQRFEEVVRLSMKALDIDPHNPEALTHGGMVLVAVGRPQEGLRALDRALEIDPDFPEALLYKGIVSFQNQDFTTAVASWEHYLEVAPADANVSRVEAMLEGARQAVGGESSP